MISTDLIPHQAPCVRQQWRMNGDVVSLGPQLLQRHHLDATLPPLLSRHEGVVADGAHAEPSHSGGNLRGSRMLGIGLESKRHKYHPKTNLHTNFYQNWYRTMRKCSNQERVNFEKKNANDILE